MTGRVRAALAAAGLLAAAPAFAHSPFPGFKGLYAGFLHPLTQPAQIMLLLALGLFLATRTETVRPAVAAAVILGALAGLVGGTVTGPTGPHATALAGLVLAAGAAVLYPAPLPRGASTALGAAGGVLLGLASIPDPGRWQAVAITSLGAWFGLAYCVVLISGATVAARRRWPGPVTRIGVQVLSAWLIAMAALYAAWLLLTPAP